MTEEVFIPDCWAGPIRLVSAGMAPPNEARLVAVRCPVCFVEVGTLAEVEPGTKCEMCG